jgi:hypothetical protein
MTSDEIFQIAMSHQEKYKVAYLLGAATVAS